jgi:hypothetical protein
MQTIDQPLGAAVDPYWRQSQVRCGKLEPTGSSLCFVTTDAGAGGYSNAQIDDYQGLPRRRFLWRPPLRLTVRARFSHAAGGDSGLRGTAGFGFWNDPFLMTGPRFPTLPRAAWFFYASPPSNIKLDLQVPGHGWKAATIDALRPAALVLAPFALPAILLMKRPTLYRKLWPSIQRALTVGEAEVGADMSEWHTYSLDWSEAGARFYVDDRPLLDAPAPRGPLGFVMWLDNQFMVATAQGRFRWGLLDAPGRQWMEIEHLSILPRTEPEQSVSSLGSTRRNGKNTTEH